MEEKMSRAGMFWLALEEDYGNIETQGELVRALLTDRERAAIQEAVEVFDGVHKGLAYAQEYFGLSVSQIAEIRAFFNGYAGSPNIDTVGYVLRDLITTQRGKDA